ncbi:hypothetical protein C4J65_17160 [Streptomyces sp. CB09001]|uniref:hypothetical protein n=1 Tax=Streptomyces sp. CB09001 TaxID=2083284 RepID=UPI000E211457|nr:hypothetical protein [Streptomyces sp. CB09001]AXL89834.1 hypothetical protein C4J65_17160 [Streptomyces sp. CB09001]
MRTSLLEMVYGPCPDEEVEADFFTLVDRALEAVVTRARTCALTGDTANEALCHRQINTLLNLREREGGAA